MAFIRPTLGAIIERVEGDMKNVLSITTILRRNFLAAMARGIAGASHVLHGHLVFVSKQIFPDQAEDEFLDRWGSIYGLGRNPAVFTQLTIDITFAAAGTVPIDTVWQRTDSVEYKTDAEVAAVGAGVVQGTITALVADENSNHADGEIVSLQSPIANVAGDATVFNTLVEGEDTEGNPEYRVRIIDRIQNPPAGGTVADYIAFAKTVTGVTRVWVLPGYLGEGTVGVTFVEDGDDPIIPDAGKVAEVQTAVDERKPVTATAVVFIPIDNPTPMTIRLKPNTTDTRAAVTAELEDLFQRESQVRGSWKSVTETYDGKIPLSRINEAISIAAGEEDHVVDIPTADPQPGTDGGILTLGTITFITLV
jgi:uncharacterized phage protein gp47/JayE